jgi:hypothetical protein
MNQVVIERRSLVQKSRGSRSSRLGYTLFQQGGRPLLPVVITGGDRWS